MSIVNRIRWDNDIILDTRDNDVEMSEAKYSASFTDRIADIKIDMTILPSHPKYEYLKNRILPEHPQPRPIVERTSTIWAWDNGREIFHGRPISADCDIYHRLKVTCECDAKFLEDVPDIFSMVSLDDKTEKIQFGAAIEKIFMAYDPDPHAPTHNYGYNRHAGSYRKIYLGGISDGLREKEIDKPSNNSVYSNLKSWLDAVEGYAKVTVVDDHYELFISESRGVEDDKFFVRYGENVTDYKIQRGAENFYTAIHAVGKDGDNFVVPDGKETLDSEFRFWLPDQESSGVIAGKVIQHFEGAQTYGEIMYHEEFDVKDETSKRQAVVDKAVESLKKKMKHYESIDISVVDPRLLGYGNDSFPVLGNSYAIDIPLFYDRANLPEEPLTKIEANLLNPGTNGKLTFGDKQNLLSGKNSTVMLTASKAAVTAVSALKTANSAATPSQVAEAIAQSEGRTADYIVESGTGGIWTWTKWASGIAECSGTTSLTVSGGAWTAAGSVFCADGSETLPVNLFQSQPDVTPSVQGSSNGNFAGWAGCYIPSSASVARYRVYRHDNYSSDRTVFVHLRCTGRWN